MKRIAVYGSLRKGLHNHARYMPGADLLGVETIWGFDMYSLGNYPYIIKGEDKVIFEIYDIVEYTMQRIRELELGAGYEESQVETGFGLATTYIMDSEQHARNIRRGLQAKVERGDWRKYLTDLNYGNRMFIESRPPNIFFWDADGEITIQRGVCR